jgi:flagellar protein FlgJ
MDEISSIIQHPVGAEKPSTGNATNQEREKKLKKTCADFGAMMVFQMLKTMRQSVPKGGLLQSSQGRETYEMLMDQKIASDLANKGQGLGLQKMLYNQLTRQNLKKD